MSSINDFFELFIDVWQQGIFGINATEIIIGFIIFLLFYVLRRLFARFVIGRLNKLVLKSKTKIDDTIVDVIPFLLNKSPNGNVKIATFVGDFSVT